MDVKGSKHGLVYVLHILEFAWGDWKNYTAPESCYPVCESTSGLPNTKKTTDHCTATFYLKHETDSKN
jgi:hypothetical protein